MKLLLPYAQLSFIGWVVWTASPPQWEVVASLLLLAWIALGIFVLRVAATALAHSFLRELQREFKKPVL